MGFFSWRCAISGESIANRHSGQPAEQSNCILVTPTQNYHEPSYDGYGDFGGVDVYKLLGEGDREKGVMRYFSYRNEFPFDIKVVLTKYYNGQTYDELPVSPNCEHQGYFYDDEDDE